MKKSILLFGLLCASAWAFAQNTNPVISKQKTALARAEGGKVEELKTRNALSLNK